MIWLKDGLSLPVKATTTTRERLSQLIIPEAELSDSGHYAISLQTEHGRKETFSFQVQVQGKDHTRKSAIMYILHLILSPYLEN